MLSHVEVPTYASIPYHVVAGPDGSLWFTEQEGNKIGQIHLPAAMAEAPTPARAVEQAPGADLATFSPVGAILFDHPDPSIFTVLTSPSDTPGTANLDFAIFPPRWLVAQDTFRPPWFHRNIASEFMGLVHGQYDAKDEGFVPGGCSIHNCMTGDGPDAATFDKASSADLSKPDVITDTMAFMFETRCVLRPTAQALQLPQLQPDYYRCWQDLKKNFTPGTP